MSFSCINDKLGTLSVESLLRSRGENRSGLSAMLNAVTKQNQELQQKTEQLSSQVQGLQEENSMLRAQLARQQREVEAALNQTVTEDCFGLEQSIHQLRELVHSVTPKKPGLHQENFAFRAAFGEINRSRRVLGSTNQEVEVWVDQLLLFFKLKTSALRSQQPSEEFLQLNTALPLSQQQEDIIREILNDLREIKDTASLTDNQERKYLHTIQNLSTQLMELRAQLNDSPRTVRDPIFYSDSEYSEFMQPPSTLH